MNKKICEASDCENEFILKMPHAKYCSDRCRWREMKRKTYEQRSSNGECPQCGGEMDTPVTIHSKAPAYCSKCQRYYQGRYVEIKE